MPHTRIYGETQQQLSPLSSVVLCGTLGERSKRTMMTAQFMNVYQEHEHHVFSTTKQMAT
jgi:hypothetical protein